MSGRVTQGFMHVLPLAFPGRPIFKGSSGFCALVDPEMRHREPLDVIANG